MAAKKTQSERTIDKAGPTKPMSKGQPGNAPDEGVQTTEQAAHRLAEDHVPEPAINSDQG